MGGPLPYFTTSEVQHLDIQGRPIFPITYDALQGTKANW